MERYKSVLLYSGGVDSFVAYHYLGMPKCVYFDLNSKYSQREINFIHDQEPARDSRLKIDTSLSFLGALEEGENAYIPFRNLYLAMTAVAKYSDKVYIAGVKDDKVSDQGRGVHEIWSAHLSQLEGRTIEVSSPFYDMTKADVVQWYVKGFNKLSLLNTVSCFAEGNATAIYCGNCNACFRKAVALFSVGLKLPFYNKTIIDHYSKSIGTGHYDKQREENMEKYINWVQPNDVRN